MYSPLISLFPGYAVDVPVRGLYLRLGLHAKASSGRPFIFANFLSSVDGRIALSSACAPEGEVPKCLKTPSDFRLLQELEAQADCIVTHGGYMRALAEGRLGDILRVGRRDESRDLAVWRQNEGLPSQPTIVIASASLDFPVPDFLLNKEQKCLIATGAQADSDRVEYWKALGFEIIFAGRDRAVEGKPLADALKKLDMRSVYLSAGPWMLTNMLRDGQLNRLFLTTTHQVIGGSPITMSDGRWLIDRAPLKLVSLYYDAHSPSGAGQFFAQYDCFPQKL